MIVMFVYDLSFVTLCLKPSPYRPIRPTPMTRCHHVIPKGWFRVEDLGFRVEGGGFGIQRVVPTKQLWSPG